MIFKNRNNNKRNSNDDDDIHHSSNQKQLEGTVSVSGDSSYLGTWTHLEPHADGDFVWCMQTAGHTEIPAWSPVVAWRDRQGGHPL